MLHVELSITHCSRRFLQLTHSSSAARTLFGGCLQSLTPIWQDDDRLALPADITASGFYITNAHNTFVGNAASGGFAGYSFPGLKAPIKDYAYVQLTPKTRPTIRFDGNTAHSTGHWWSSAGGVYVGGVLEHDASRGGKLVYDPGRNNQSPVRDGTRATCLFSDAGSEKCQLIANNRWLMLENTKVSLANRGIQFWGERMEIHGFEVRPSRPPPLARRALLAFPRTNLQGLCVCVVACLCVAGFCF